MVIPIVILGWQLNQVLRAFMVFYFTCCPSPQVGPQHHDLGADWQHRARWFWSRLGLRHDRSLHPLIVGCQLELAFCFRRGKNRGVTRDELIEELKNCPYNHDVKVKLVVSVDYLEEMFRNRIDDVEIEVPIFAVTAIPSITIDCTDE